MGDSEVVFVLQRFAKRKACRFRRLREEVGAGESSSLFP